MWYGPQRPETSHAKTTLNLGKFVTIIHPARKLKNSIRETQTLSAHLSCKTRYIGETGRPLCVRIKEHLDRLSKSKTTTPLGSDEGDIAETLASIKINNHLGKQLERILAYSATTITMPGFKDSGTWKHLTTVLQKWANFVRV
ncbi:hypothetical protein Y032_0722g1837 [Ancylostoma ceylanicum]|nr:hypothetical protein Y032_0722g1837 [Ancylostoma ceylanicum]